MNSELPVNGCNHNIVLRSKKKEGKEGERPSFMFMLGVVFTVEFIQHLLQEAKAWLGSVALPKHSEEKFAFTLEREQQAAQQLSTRGLHDCGHPAASLYYHHQPEKAAPLAAETQQPACPVWHTGQVCLWHFTRIFWSVSTSKYALSLSSGRRSINGGCRFIFNLSYVFCILPHGAFHTKTAWLRLSGSICSSYLYGIVFAFLTNTFIMLKQGSVNYNATINWQDWISKP